MFSSRSGKSSLKSTSKTRGFTLVEAMIAMSIGLVVAGSAIWFLVEGTRISLKTSSACTNDLAQWGVMTSLTLDTKIANGMEIYPTFDRATLGNVENRVKEKGVGNVLILFRTLQSNDPASKAAKYQEIAGYTLDNGTLKKFSYQVPAEDRDSGKPLETILDAHFNELVLLPMTDNVTAGAGELLTDGKVKTGSFICRAVGKSGELNVQVSNGHANVRTESKKLIAASFFVRG